MLTIVNPISVSFPNRAPFLGPGDAHIWMISLDLPAGEISFLDGLLSLAEKESFERLINKGEAARRIAARGRLRQILELYTGIPAHQLILNQQDGGKPVVDSAQNSIGIEFNLSHTGGLCAAIFNLHKRVGIDIEKICAYEDIQHIQYALPDQQAPINNAPSLLAAWTVQEAKLKAYGTGWRGLPADQITNHFYAENFIPAPGYIGAWSIIND